MVNIKKLKINYELRYGFSKLLNNFIDSFPKEHRSTRCDKIRLADGTIKNDWVRVIREIQIGKVIEFLIDNNISFVLDNVTPSDIAILKKQYKERQSRIREALKFKNEQIQLDGSEDYSYMKLEPYEYQKKGIKFFEINNGNAILGDQPGVGKTAQAIAYAAKHKLKTLVVCPSSLKFMWKDSVAKFTDETGFIYKFFPKKSSKEKNNPKDDSLFHIINFESLKTFIYLEYKHKCTGMRYNPAKSKMEPCKEEIIDINKKPPVCPNCGAKKGFKTRIKGVQYFQSKEGEYIDVEEYDLLVIDEFHRIKNMKTDWTQIIRRSLKNIPQKILMSGTAIKSRPMEFFSSLNFLMPEEFNNQHQFGIRYCAAYEDNFGWVYDGASNLEELYTRISPFYLRRLKKDVLSQLPPKTYTTIKVELSPKDQKEYAKIEKEMKLVEKDGVMEEVEKGYMEKIHKLKQFTEKIKFNEIKEFLHEVASSGDKVVVFFEYLETADIIKKEFGDLCVVHTGKMSNEEKNHAVKEFQENKKIKIFAGTVLSAGVGLTLTAANKLVFIGQAWTRSDIEQAEDRIHRADTTHDNIQIITYLCMDTIDIDIYELLEEKEAVVNKVLDGKDKQRKINTGDKSIIKNLVDKMKKR